MGLKISSLNALTYGDMLDNRYDIYKINELSKIEYFKVEDLLDFDVKKCIEPVVVKDRMAQKLYLIIYQLNHPNIIRVDCFVEDDIFYVVRLYDDDFYAFAWRLQIQKYLETRRKNIKIEEEQIIYWMKQLLSALACLHDNNILHKFIIPECISFKRDRLRLFIPARSTVLNSNDQLINEKMTWYRCPEHEKSQEIGLKYDIWSAGWTLYNLCALDDGRFVLDQIESFDNWEKPDIPRYYTRDIDRIFQKMTNLDPEKRPTAREILQDPIFDDN